MSEQKVYNSGEIIAELLRLDKDTQIRVLRKALSDAVRRIEWPEDLIEADFIAGRIGYTSTEKCGEYIKDD